MTEPSDQFRQAVEAARATLAAAGLPSPEVDARRLGDFARQEAGSPAEQLALVHALAERRAQREPLQHLTGAMSFRFLDLEASPGAFVVRPETEWMCDEAVAEAQRLEAPRIVDLCTGSGAIALALATEVESAEVWAVELSAAALAVAERNSARYGSPLHLVHADAREALGELDGTVDIVLSNPPYVPDEEVAPEALADPALALWGGGPEGLVMPQAMVARAAQLLRPGGLLLLEHAPSQAGELRAYAERLGFVDVSTGRDGAGRERWLRARAGEECRGTGEAAAGQATAAEIEAAQAPAVTTAARGDELPVDATASPSVLPPARRYPFDREARSTPAFAEALLAAGAAIRAGELVLLPTDTVYGIGADAFSPAAVTRLLEAKGRGRDKPSPVLVASLEAAESLAEFTPSARALAEAFWPGALTLILPARPGLGWDLGETGGTVALRMPDHPATLALLAVTGPLAVSSANLTEEPPARSADEALAMLGHATALCLDAGECAGGVPSTIVRLGGERGATASGARGELAVEIVRLGAVGDTDIRDVLDVRGRE